MRLCGENCGNVIEWKISDQIDKGFMFQKYFDPRELSGF